MTGTADTEAFELRQIYSLEVVVMPTNQPMVRDDRADLVYLTQEEKTAAIIEDILDCVKRGQPALVGTVSIESSELLSNVLKKEKIEHSVLNAKFHEKEAEIVAHAGAPGTVTIATNMAGRGTDIVLGGNLQVELDGVEDLTENKELQIREDWQKRHDQVVAAGGLAIIGTERHDQRKVIYEQRAELMSTEDISDTIDAIRYDVVNDTISSYIPPQSVSEMWDVSSLEERLKADFLLDIPVQKWLDNDDELHEEPLRERIHDKILDAYKLKEEAVGDTVMRHFEKSIMLQHLDSLWKEHLSAMDHLRQGIHLRGYAQKNPKQEYKREAFELFTQMLDEIKTDVVGVLAKVQVKEESDVDAVEEQRRQQAMAQGINFQHAQTSAMGEAEAAEPESAPQAEEHIPFVREGRKVGRNEPCPCGSGKKFKQCHGKLS